jgi:NAD(P)-dependent dehydrogenase (short-subunit alcohol dehydrogenase family)
MPSFDLTGQVALVTGGTKGIGNGIVRQMLAAGAAVALTSRTAVECDEVAAELGDEFGRDRVIGIACDLADLEAAAPLIAAVTERFGSIDALIANAAATGGHGPLVGASLEHFTGMLQANVVGNFELGRLAAEQMAARGAGSIVFVTSIAASTPMPTNVAYAASKAALTSMAVSLAAEYAAHGVRVNCLAPGLIRSYSSSTAFSTEDNLRAYAHANIPLGRIGEPEEVGATCVFLTSSAGAYITAAVIPVDGGRAGLGQITRRPD